MSKDKHFAVVVAIDRYPGFADRNLKGPVNDARAFIQWLEDPAGGDLPAKNVRSLLSEPSQDDPARPAPGDAHPKAREVDALFRPFYKQGQDARIGERLYIFASGHGVSDPIDLHSAALLTANASPASSLKAVFSQFGLFVSAPPVGWSAHQLY